MEAIIVSDLLTEYRRPFRAPVRAVDGLSFSVGRGEVVGFLGVNGAGKTTTIKNLMGFQPATAGSVTVLAKPVGDVSVRAKVGFLPETALYSPYLTPYETLRLYGELSGLRGGALDARIAVLLERVGIPEKSRTLNRHLSKGMLQRVGIAQALLAEPELLILDEVTSGLDPLGRKDLRDLLEAERGRGVTVFFSSHELGVVEELCDRILVLNKGKLIAEHPMADLRARVASLEDFFVELVRNGRNPLLEAAA